MGIAVLDSEKTILLRLLGPGGRVGGSGIMEGEGGRS